MNNYDQLKNIYKIIHLDEVDSTNDYAKKLINNYELPTLIYANYQTSGKGRMGRTFLSNKDKGIYMSILFKPDFSLDKINKITGYTSCIVAEEIDKISGLNTYIKWVNDIYINNLKVCGILTESVIKNEECYIIVGIGINVHSQTFNELHDIATSIEDNANIKIDKFELIHNIALAFYNNLNQINTKEYIKVYVEKSNVIGKNVELLIGDKIVKGKCVNINDDGELVVFDGIQNQIIYSGYITKVKIQDE